MSTESYSKSFLIMGNTSGNADNIAVHNSKLLYVSLNLQESIDIASNNRHDISLDGFYQHIFIIPVDIESQIPIANQGALLFRYDQSLGTNVFSEIIDFSFNIETVPRHFEIRLEEYEDGVSEYVAQINSIESVNAMGVGYSKSEAVIELASMLLSYLTYKADKKDV